MKEIGLLLYEAREKNGKSLEQISKETKLTIKQLRALEEGDFSGFAGKVYLKGALKNFAGAVGADCQDLLALYEYNYAKNDSAAEKTNALSGFKGDKIKTGRILVRKVKKHADYKRLTWIAVFITLIGVMVLYGYQQAAQYWEVDTQEFPTQQAREDEVPTAANGLNDYVTEPAIMPEELQQPQLSFLEGDNRGGTYTIKGVSYKEIELRFEAECWISIEQDNRFIGQRIYSKGEYRRLPNAAVTRIRFGNPPAARVVVNGIEIDVSGFIDPYNLTVRRE